MEKQLKPGDKIKWYRDTTPVPGTILKVTPKRVKIETIGNDGRPTAHYVSPKSVGIAPSNEPQLPPQARKKDKQQGIDPFSAKSTLLWQTLAGLLCLGAGGSLISLLILWANQWGLYYSDHSKHDFLPGAIYVAISVLILTGYITKKQFDEAIAIGDIFRSSIRTFLWGWACFMACYSIMLLAILLIGGSFLIVAVEIALWFMSFIMFGVTIGTIQYFRLKLEGFDQAKHLQFLSPEADLAACKAGVLPYQVRVRAFWPIMVITFFSLLSLTGWLMIIPTDDGEIEGALLFIGVALGVVGIGKAIGFNGSLTNITSVEGNITEEKIYSSRGPTRYYLICNKRKFKTDAKIWRKINARSRNEYRLWYSPTNMVVVAAEVINYKPRPIVDRQQREEEIAYIKQNRTKFVEEALQRGLQGPVPQIELDMDQYLSNKHPLPNDLFYIFEIPILDNQIHIESYTASTELSAAGRRALENQAKIDELVQRLSTGLRKLPDAKKSYEVRAIANHWPILVTLGGEIVPPLVAAAGENEDITTQVLISQLLGDIARDTSARLSQQIPDLLCQRCFVRCVAHEIKVPWRTNSFLLSTDLIYYGCRTCSQSRKFLPHTGPIIAALDERMEEHYVQAGALKVNWLIQKNMFDFDKVEIGQAGDEAVERFAMQVGNDTDEVRQPRYKRIPCTVSASCGLSPNSIRILQRTFGQVNIE